MLTISTDNILTIWIVLQTPEAQAQRGAYRYITQRQWRAESGLAPGDAQMV